MKYAIIAIVFFASAANAQTDTKAILALSKQVSAMNMKLAKALMEIQDLKKRIAKLEGKTTATTKTKPATKTATKTPAGVFDAKKVIALIPAKAKPANKKWTDIRCAMVEAVFDKDLVGKKFVYTAKIGGVSSLDGGRAQIYISQIELMHGDYKIVLRPQSSIVIPADKLKHFIDSKDGDPIKVVMTILAAKMYEEPQIWIRGNIEWAGK